MIGKSAECKCCAIETPWFIVRGDNITLCLTCYEEGTWDHRNATKEATTKGGGFNGSKASARKRKGNRSADRWAASLVATSKSNPQADQ